MVDDFTLEDILPAVIIDDLRRQEQRRRQEDSDRPRLEISEEPHSHYRRSEQPSTDDGELPWREIINPNDGNDGDSFNPGSVYMARSAEQGVRYDSHSATAEYR